ncbi:MAG: FixH family protein [Pseudomonadota bacterium]
MSDMTDDKERSRELTGRKVLIIALSAFGVVLAVNLTMMTLAITGFPGLVTSNPYAAGQNFDAEMQAERDLGWQVGATYDGARLIVDVNGPEGAPVQDLGVSVRIGRPATDAYDRTLAMTLAEDGAHAAALDLAPGVWRVEVTALRPSDGARYVIVDQVRARP